MVEYIQIEKNIQIYLNIFNNNQEYIRELLLLINKIFDTGFVKRLKNANIVPVTEPEDIKGEMLKKIQQKYVEVIKMELELKNIHTDAEGLKKIIDFLHSKENLCRSEVDRYRFGGHSIFSLENARAVSSDKYNKPIETGYYLVDIGVRYTPLLKEHIDGISDLLKEVYRGIPFDS